MAHSLSRAARLTGVLVLASSLFLASCGDGGDIDNELSFRVIHASPDSPLVNIRVDGVALRSGVDYKGGTGFIFVTPRTYQFEVEAILPGEDLPVIDEAVPLVAGSEFTVIAVGKSATPSTVHSLIIENPFVAIPDGNARVQFVHTAPDQPPLDVYLTSAGASLPAATPLAQVTYDEYPADRQLVPPGSYVLRVTPAGDPTTVLFDSGPLGDLRNRDDLLIVLVQNTAAGSSPISLVINNGFSSFEALDKSSPSELRVVSLSPDAPALDVIGSPTTTSFPEIPFSSVDNLSGIALDEANGRALVVDNRLGAVVAVDLQSGVRSVLSDNTSPNATNPFRGPAGIAVDAANDRALVTDKSQGALLAVDLQTGARTILSGRFAPDDTNPFFRPLGIAVDSANGRALVVDNGQAAVLAVNLQTGARTFLSNNTTPDAVNPFGFPVGIALDSANGRALVVDNLRDSVLSVNLETGVRTVLSNSTVPDAVNPLGSPVGIALDAANGRALVLDNLRTAAFAVNLQTGARAVFSNATTPDAVNAFSGPAGIALDSANGRALVVDNRLGAVVALNLQTGARSILSAGSPGGIAFLGNTGYVSVLADSYLLRGEKTAAPNATTPLFSTSSSLFAGQRETVFVNGLLANIFGQVSVDNTRPVFTEGKLRFLHAAPAAGTVDVYMLPTGAPIADEDPILQNLVLSSIVGHLGVAPANYTITFTRADSKTELIAVQNVAALASTANTVILVDEVRVDSASDGKPASVLVLDDLAD